MLYDFKANERLKIYPVRLPCFEGPLDLLLYLIKENQIDIYDIPISLITEQYLAYLELMRILDLEIAGEFLVLASTLMRIKAKMLLPPSEEEEEDPREELVEALLDYQRYRETADFLREKEAEQSLFYPRSFFSPAENHDQDEEKSSQVSLYSLLEAFKRILDKASEEPSHTVTVLKVTMEQRIHHILSCLNNKKRVSFKDLFMDDPRRLVMIVTFIAVLELIRLEKIKVLQRRIFSEIWVYANHSSTRRKELKPEGKIEQ